MNKADLLGMLKQLKITNSCTVDYDTAIDDAIELVEQLTCITDLTFPAVIKEPVVLRDYGTLYLVKDASDDYYYITRTDDWVWRDSSDNAVELFWTKIVNQYYPETRETK